MAPTGKDHARVNLAIWDDDNFRSLRADEQHLYFVLWTSPALSYCGAGTWHPGRLSQLADGWTKEQIEKAGAGLSRKRFVLIDTDTDEFLIRSWIKHDGLWRIPNMAVSIANARACLASKMLRGVVVHEVLRVQKSHADSGSWKRDSVVAMLDQKAIDPASVPPFNPGVNPDSNPAANPPVNPSANPWPNPKANPGSNPGPTPTPSPPPSPSGGYVSRNLTSLEEKPAEKCPTHFDDPNPPPCRACGEARRNHEAWQAEQKRARIEAEREQRATQADVERAAIDACRMCDDRGYLNRRVCNHDPDEFERNQRGIAALRAVFDDREKGTA